METQKGMSQTLALIVAASVLMMTALTVIFMVQGGLSDTNEGLSRSECIQAVEARCNIDSGGSPSVPESCIQVDDDGDREIAFTHPDLPDSDPGAPLTCGN